MSLTISRVLHAGYLFSHGATRIAFDPVFENPFSGNCHAFPAVRFDQDAIRTLSLDAIFISHFHDDHCSLDSLNLLSRDIPVYLYCLFDELFDMIRALGFHNVHALQLDVPVRVGAMDIIPRRALESNVDSMFQVRVDGLNVLNVVDATIDPPTLRQLARYAPWDVVLWPFQIMREAEVIAPRQALPAPAGLPAEWLEQLQRLKPRVVVPSSCQFRQESWSWYNRAFFPVSYALFQREVSAALPTAHLLRLNPGQGLILVGDSIAPAPPLPWIIPEGPQEVDYDYDPEAVAPPVNAIAAQFAPLLPEQAEQVWRYCRHEIMDVYASLDAIEEGYFASPKHWYLSVYDHTGAVTHFHYRVDADQLILLAQSATSDTPVAPDWCTEVILKKLHAALFCGETLTSMYLRINDREFPEDTLAALADTEIADDPLIRCVFDGHFAAYQREQLRRLGLSL